MSTNAHRMSPAVVALAAAFAGVSWIIGGCAVPRTIEPTPVPPPGVGPVRETPELRPLPSPQRRMAFDDAGSLDRAFRDVPLVRQDAPEGQAFLDAYDRVGRPTIRLAINRDDDGLARPVTSPRVTGGSETVRRSDAAVTVERQSGRGLDRSTDRFSADGPATYTETRTTYAGGRDADELDARRIDYDAIEAILTDFLAGDGRVNLVRPDARRPGDEPDSDVRIDVSAGFTSQSEDGRYGRMRIVARAADAVGGGQLGQAVVDLEPPLTKQRVNGATRYVARKLMDDLTRSWSTRAVRGDEGAIE